MECIVRLIGMNRLTVEDNSAIFLACDTILNILLRVCHDQQGLMLSILQNIYQAAKPFQIFFVRVRKYKFI